MSSAKTRATLLGLPVALLVACGGNNPSSTSQSTPDQSGEIAGPVAPTSPAVTAPSPTGEMAVKPVVTVPDGAPPTELKIRDIVVGTGPEAKSGQTVSVQYVGVSYSTKKEFDSSWDRGAKPIDFPIGVGRVIKGWDQGVPGMKVGGRRELIIPPELGYGERGSAPDIKPGETLVFVVDLVGLE
jgi:peptidylprolyl isomerase